MTISNVGFRGTVDEVEWANITSLVGSDYCVAGTGDWAPTAVPGARQAAIAAGDGFGSGILSSSDASEVLTLANPGTGGRWYLIVARRDWAARTCEFKAIAGATTSSTTPTATPASYPAERFGNPGVKDDQPICWVWVNAATTSVLIFDLRYLPPWRRLYSLEQSRAQLRQAKRAWKFEREAAGGSDSFGSGSFVGLISGAIPSAPAGDYEISVTASLQSNAPAIGNVRIHGGGQFVAEDIRHDLDTISRVLTHVGVVEDFAGGDFVAGFLFQPAAGTATIQTNGAAIRVAYLGPRN